jgi:hypothetical protein
MRLQIPAEGAGKSPKGTKSPQNGPICREKQGLEQAKEQGEPGTGSTKNGPGIAITAASEE